MNRGKQLINAVFHGHPTDRIPSCPIMSRCNAQLVSASIREFLTDPETMVKAQMAAYDRYRPDILAIKGDPLMEAGILGNEVRFPDDTVCYSTRVALENKGKLSGLHQPDPTTDGRLKDYTGTVAELSKKITDTHIFPFLNGPWTIAVELRRAEKIIRDIKSDPVFYHELMEFTTRISIRSWEALLPFVEHPIFSECHASSSFISSEHYRNFIFPYHKKIIDRFKEKRVGVGLHICGYADPILQDMVNTGATLISIDAPTDLIKAAEVARGKAVLMGNINPNLFSFGTKKNMKRAIEKCIHDAQNNSAYILASGCEISGSASPEKVAWFMELTNELGRRETRC